ncbi:MAG: peptidyl-prolyl cis-trans isomerase [Lachnospiraceae bacterium]
MKQHTVLNNIQIYFSAFGKRMVLMLGMSCAVISLLTACGQKHGWLFSLNGETISKKDVDAFGFIYTKEHNIVNTGQMDEIYESGDTYGEYFKKELEDEIVSTVLLYKEAEDSGKKLSNEDKEQAEKKAEEVESAYGKEWLEQKDVSKSDIKRVYEMKLLGNSYIESLSEENPEDVEGGKTEEPAEKERYIKVYQVLFPTVELDAEGMVKSNTDGSVKKLSLEETEMRKEQAEEFSEKASDADMETLLKDYDQSVTGMEKYLKYADLEKDYKQAVDALSEGKVSGVIESSYGYYVIKLLESDSKEYVNNVETYAEQTKIQNKKAEILKTLYNTYVGDDKNYRNDKLWEKVTILDYLQ